jgi:hypothetical protein
VNHPVAAKNASANGRATSRWPNSARSRLGRSGRSMAQVHATILWHNQGQAVAL